MTNNSNIHHLDFSFWGTYWNKEVIRLHRAKIIINDEILATIKDKKELAKLIKKAVDWILSTFDAERRQKLELELYWTLYYEINWIEKITIN